jgi:hypothetical protein
MRRPLPPILLRDVLPEPSVVRELVERDAPYAPVQRYFRSQAEYGTVGAQGPMIVAPNFRGDWATERKQLRGVDPILDHPGFIEATRKIWSAEVVRPEWVFVNLTWQLPFPQGPGHTDVPAFLGIDRSEHPIWLLSAMGHSRLFEAERVDIVTAVAWFYLGTDGGLTYWPDGPDQPARIHEGTIFNTALVGDNDFMFHRVNPVGSTEAGLPRGLTLETRLEHRGGDAWAVVDGDRVIGEPAYDELRISVSWKARVFADAETARVHDSHQRDLCLADVVGRFRADLLGRGIPCPEPSDPLADPAFVEAVRDAYVSSPPAPR